MEALEVRLKSQGIKVIRIDETMVQDFVSEEKGREKLVEVVKEEIN